MEEELKSIVGNAVLSGVSSCKTTIKMAKALKYWNTHLNIILMDLAKGENLDKGYVNNVLKTGEKILKAEQHVPPGN